MDTVPLSQLEPSDDALALRIARKDIAAFAEIYGRYARAVFSFAVHMLGENEAEEVVQEVFLRLWNKAHQFDARQGSFGAWFMTIARNCVKNELKTKTLQQRIVAAEGINLLLNQANDPVTGVEEQVWMDARAAAVLNALQMIPEEQRRVIVLAYFGELTQTLIAEHLDLPLGTVKKRIRLGLQKLRTLLAREQMMSPSEPGSIRGTRE